MTFIENPIKKNILKVFGKEPESLDELAKCVIAVINSKLDRNKKEVKVSGFAWDISYSELVRNTYSSPFGYDKNWRGVSGAPKGYP